MKQRFCVSRCCCGNTPTEICLVLECGNRQKHTFPIQETPFNVFIPGVGTYVVERVALGALSRRAFSSDENGILAIQVPCDCDTTGEECAPWYFRNRPFQGFAANRNFILENGGSIQNHPARVQSITTTGTLTADLVQFSNTFGTGFYSGTRVEFNFRNVFGTGDATFPGVINIFNQILVARQNSNLEYTDLRIDYRRTVTKTSNVPLVIFGRCQYEFELFEEATVSVVGDQLYTLTNTNSTTIFSECSISQASRVITQPGAMNTRFDLEINAVESPMELVFPSCLDPSDYPRE